MRLKTYAKVNLFLEITGKRPDGYHTLSTIFQTISLADELTLKRDTELRLTCSDPTLPTDERNLALRAALKLQTALEETRSAQIHLEKRIPTGAGLGGGSSDAAAVLQGLLKLWGRRLQATPLHRLAVDLGADVPFFLKGGLCAATGIGDRLRPLPRLRKTWLVLVYPGFGISTREAYAKVRLPLTGSKSIHRMIPLLSRQHPADWTGHLFNRFEEFIFPEYPQLARLKQELIDAGALGALMSGSGSSVFGVVESAQQGRKVLADIKRQYKQSWLVHTI